MAREADGYLEKPIHFQKLKGLIQELVSSKEKQERRFGKDMPYG
jgi:hypothetical protein